MQRRKPAGALPAAARQVLAAYGAGQISADVAAERYIEAVQGTEGSVALQLDRTFREALHRALIARGMLPPDTPLEPDD